MKREDVYKIIDSEREFQIDMTARDDRPDMIKDLHVGDTISAIQHNLVHAREAWYSGSVPHEESMEYIRKIAGLCVQLGEKYDMPKRKR